MIDIDASDGKKFYNQSLQLLADSLCVDEESFEQWEEIVVTPEIQALVDAAEAERQAEIIATYEPSRMEILRADVDFLLMMEEE